MHQELSSLVVIMHPVIYPYCDYVYRELYHSFMIMHLELPALLMIINGEFSTFIMIIHPDVTQL